VAPSATLALSADSATAGGVQLSMTDVVDLALRNNPTTRQSWALAQSAADVYGASRGSLYPTINGNVDLQRSGGSGGGGGVLNTTGGATTTTGGGDTAGTGTGTRTNTGTGGSGGGSTTRTELTPSVSLSYLVLDFGGRAGSIEGAKQRAIAADLSHNATVNDVVLQAESTLFSYLATRSLRDAQITAVQEAAADTAASEARLRVGVGTLQDVLQTTTALAQARFQLATLQGNLLSARGALAVAMGLPANARFDVPAVPASDSVASVGASVDTLIDRAITARPELAEARANAAALAADIRVARAAGYPALTLSSTGSYERPLGAGSSSIAGGRSYSLLLGLQIPIFDGFSRQYDVRSAQAQYEAGLAEVASTEQQITVQVFTSFAALQTATDGVTSAVQLLASAQQSANVAVGTYREGVGTIVDVLLARSALDQARAEEIQARWQWQTALAQLAHDVGSLDLNGRPNVPLRIP
jgi:outer membrane protein TolC